MQRIASTFALAGWMGFAAISGLAAAARLAGLSLPEALSAWPGPAVLASGTSVAALGSVPIAVLLGAALVCLHGAKPGRRRLGERLGLAALGTIGLLAAVAALGGVPVFPVVENDAAFWMLLVSGVLAVGFDHFVTEDADADDEANFHAGIALIAAGMARQTELYADRAGTARRLPDGQGPSS